MNLSKHTHTQTGIVFSVTALFEIFYKRDAELELETISTSISALLRRQLLLPICGQYEAFK